MFLTYSQRVIAAIITIVAITACGPDGHHFRIDGRILNMSRGEFYVYSPDGLLSDIDTIRVDGGRFGYEMPCEQEGIVVIVMPNYSQLPIFVQPGKTIDMKANASQMKEVKITGTDTNEEYYKWRQSIDGMAPPEQKKQAEEYIRKNPYSVISRWLLRQFFITDVKPDYKKVKELIPLMQKKGEENPMLSRLENSLGGVAKAQVGDRLPTFSAVDINGKAVSSADFSSGKAVILLWATWNFDGINLHRMLKMKCQEMKKEGIAQPKILSISVDASITDTRNSLKYDSIAWPVVNEQKMWDSPLVKTFGFSNVPDNILVKDGKIVARHIRIDELMQELKK